MDLQRIALMLKMQPSNDSQINQKPTEVLEAMHMQSHGIKMMMKSDGLIRMSQSKKLRLQAEYTKRKTITLTHT